MKERASNMRQASSDDHIKALQNRIQELETENARLKAEMEIARLGLQGYEMIRDECKALK
jgi:uncharacterized protein (DUF3084 family)